MNKDNVLELPENNKNRRNEWEVQRNEFGQAMTNHRQKKVIHGNRAQTMEKVKQTIIQYPKCN